MRSVFLTTFVIAAFAAVAIGQPPRQAGGPPPWALKIDVNRNGKIDLDEYRAAANAFFSKVDRNSDGILQMSELPGRPNPNQPPNPQVVPHFLFLGRVLADITRAAFDEMLTQRFASFDRNSDVAIDWQEIRNVRGPGQQPGTQNILMARFVGAEFRFGDKIVKGAPFSAETVREESKRLFDGSIVKNESKGQIYRDGEGRIRQEMPLESINGFPVQGRDNEPLKLIHIVDQTLGKAYSLNDSAKTYFEIPFARNSPLATKEEPQDAKTESLGKKTFDGVTAEGTRTTIEVPVGQIGNDRPVLVVTERWFSPELQMVVMSKHTDPFIGEVVFRLANIKLGEPAADLFKVPADFTIQQPIQQERRPQPDNKRPPRRNEL
ncbi:MAG TPA: hypothetical protein PKO33_12155 [Pyrinomonadaceae bacterium]|nr:hypothetical protein [Pyrinomonadaceae bacterium]